MPAGDFPPLRAIARLLSLAWLFVLPVFTADAQLNGSAIGSDAIAEVPTISSRMQRQLAQVDALLDEESWDEALDLLDLLIEDSGEKLVQVGPAQYVTLRQRCQAILARLPIEPLAGYRDRIDPIARRLLREGRERRDSASLERLVDRFFVSRWAGEALLLLGDLALERGDFGEARRWWRRIHPALSGPGHCPLAWSLQGVDLQRYGTEVWQVLLSPPPDRAIPIFPDSNIDASLLLTRLVIASIREGDLDRAEIEINLLRQIAPTAKGRLAGRMVSLVSVLQGMKESAADWPPTRSSAGWPMYGGDPTRGRIGVEVGDIAGPIWSVPTPFQPLAAPNRILRRSLKGGMISEPNKLAPPLYVAPATVGSLILFRNSDTLQAVDLTTGRVAVNRDGVLHRTPLSTPEGPNAPGEHNDEVRRLRLQLLARRQAFLGQRATNVLPTGPLMVANKTLFGRVNPDLQASPNPHRRFYPRILGFDLRREGLLAVEFEQPESPWGFSGPPLVVGGRAYVALADREVRPRAAVACYSSQTGQLLWQTVVGSGPPSTPFGLPSRSDDLLTLAGDTVYFNTNFGAIASLNRWTGVPRWIRCYDRDDSLRGSVARSPNTQRLAPCMYHRGRLYVAPTDSRTTFALDAISGNLLWATDQLDPDLHLLGVLDGAIIATGRRIAAVEVDSGRLRYQWPESDKAGIRGMGRGCLAGDEIFWPTRNQIFVFNASTGAQSRPPIDLAPLGEGGANLTPVDGLLVVATRANLTTFGPFLPRAKPEEESELPPSSLSPIE